MHSQKSSPPIFALGILGAAGALLIVIADIAYNVFGGDQIGRSLYVSTYFGVFFFPLWWAGIYVLYQGLKPAGRLWSLYPCLCFAVLVSTVNVFLHSSFPYYAAIHEVQRSASDSTLASLQRLESLVQSYTNPIYTLQSIVEAIMAVWLTIPIVRGKSLFPRWMALLIPVYPLAVLYLIDVIIPGAFRVIAPYVASGSMCLIFVLSAIMVQRRDASTDTE